MLRGGGFRLRLEFGDIGFLGVGRLAPSSCLLGLGSTLDRREHLVEVLDTKRPSRTKGLKNCSNGVGGITRIRYRESTGIRLPILQTPISGSGNVAGTAP